MSLERFQAEIRHAYVRGGPGAIISGLVWLAAALTASFAKIDLGFYVLFFGGMLIFPLSKGLLSLFFRRQSESRENPGGLMVMETVFPMIGGLFAAWLLLPHRPDFVFSVSAIAVGAHYFGFRSAYGDWTYWIFGGTLMMIGTASIIVDLPQPSLVPYLVAVTEILFGAWFIAVDYRANESIKEAAS